MLACSVGCRRPRREERAGRARLVVAISSATRRSSGPLLADGLALLAAGTPAGDLPEVALDAEELAKAAPRRANNYGVASTMPPDAKTKRVDKLDLDALLERARTTGAPVTLCRC